MVSCQPKIGVGLAASATNALQTRDFDLERIRADPFIPEYIETASVNRAASDVVPYVTVAPGATVRAV